MNHVELLYEEYQELENRIFNKLSLLPKWGFLCLCEDGTPIKLIVPLKGVTQFCTICGGNR